MVKDNEIKTKESPFAIKEGEVKKFDGYSGYTSINSIVSKMERSHMGDLELEILKIINEYEFITSRHINKLLALKNMGIDNSRKLTRKLDQLLKSKLVSRCYFGTVDQKSSYRVYSLEKNGKFILEAKGVEVHWKPTDNIKGVNVIKKRLASNQLLIAFLEKSKHLTEVSISRRITLPSNTKGVKAQGVLTFGSGVNKIEVVLETVRRIEDWKEKLSEDLEVYQEFYNNFKSGDAEFLKSPNMLFVCEDKKHMAEVYKQLLLSEFDIQKKIYFTYDTLQIQDSLKNTWFEFVVDEESNKIKLQPLSIEILD